MPTFNLSVASAIDSVWSGLVNGGEVKRTKTGKGSMGKGDIRMSAAPDLDAKINSVTLRFYGKSSRSNQTLYPITLEYNARVDGGGYKVGASESYTS
jgi:hypothetical protein